MVRPWSPKPKTAVRFSYFLPKRRATMEKRLKYNGVEYNNFYISDDGKLFNKKTGTEYKTQVNKCGYVTVCVSFGSRYNKKEFKIHRAVACTFIPNPNNLPEVNHKDGNKLNNFVNNLEWCTSRENLLHAYKNGLKKPTIPRQKAILQYDLQHNIIKEFPSAMEAARQLGNENYNCHITKCANKKRKSAYGYIWKWK